MKKKKAKTKYNHLFDMAFSVETETDLADDVSGAELLVALMRRVADITEEMRQSEFKFKEWAGNCGDSYEVEP